MTTFGIILWIGIAILVVLPPGWDPAILLKEWVIKKRDEENDK